MVIAIPLVKRHPPRCASQHEVHGRYQDVPVDAHRGPDGAPVDVRWLFVRSGVSAGDSILHDLRSTFETLLARLGA